MPGTEVRSLVQSFHASGAAESRDTKHSDPPHKGRHGRGPVPARLGAGPTRGNDTKAAERRRLSAATRNKMKR